MPAEAPAVLGERHPAATEHQPVADARADGQDGETVESAARPEPGLGLDQGGHVVLHDDRQPGALPHQSGERHLPPAEERRPGDHRALAHQTAHADADAGRSRAPLRQCGGHLREQGGDSVRIAPGERTVEPAGDLAAQVGDDAVDHVTRDLEAEEGPGVGHDPEGL
ncbi:hypothetical protein GCM10010339_44710 [Streptomyces alanosinicus]|uniref:Uncharacterized protein n=1 Tax=Streptomyces alanosinicus TaxID=68171 RepID=A0A918YKA0_9ACTN|nr:hypothetical protein GCM10010339_44710 [Streptomyces alanosinicus]